jgi:hypothetical protein
LGKKIFGSVRKNILARNDVREAVTHCSAKSIQVPHDPQSFESQMRLDHRNLRHPVGYKARITASRNDGNLFSRKLFRFDSRQNLPN